MNCPYGQLLEINKRVNRMIDNKESDLILGYTFLKEILSSPSFSFLKTCFEGQKQVLPRQN